MPIQNIGTLLENMAVTEAAAVLLGRIGAGQDLGFATAFAMPVISEWRPHAQSVGISSEALRQIARTGESSEFINVMSRCLRYCSVQGPNSALLVSLAATLHRTGLSIWANDIADGHYGNAIPSLQNIAEVVRKILPECRPAINVSVCDAPYPLSLDHLRNTLQKWGHNVGAVLGFLDPMRYVRGSRQGAYTHPTDHRRWLSILRDWRTSRASLAVHFTGNSDSASLRDELEAMREDLEESGFPFWLEIRRQHYVVSVGSLDKQALEALEARTASSWIAWCEQVPEIVHRDLQISRSWDTDAPSRLTSGFSSLRPWPSCGTSPMSAGTKDHHEKSDDRELQGGHVLPTGRASCRGNPGKRRRGDSH